MADRTSLKTCLRKAGGKSADEVSSKIRKTFGEHKRWIKTLTFIMLRPLVYTSPYQRH